MSSKYVSTYAIIISTLAVVNADGKTEIFPGFRVYGDSVAVQLARNQNGPQSMMSHLMFDIFTEEQLKTCNYRGGKSKINSTELQKPALPKRKIDAIQGNIEMKSKAFQQNFYSIYPSKKYLLIGKKNFKINLRFTLSA